MTISGHQTRSVFDRYNIVSEDDVRQTMGEITAYVASLPNTPAIMPLPQRSLWEYGQNPDRMLGGITLRVGV